MKHLKKSLSLVLSVLMVVTTVASCFVLIPAVKANAASVKASSVIMNELSFWAPEAIYLYPNGSSDKATTATPFQFYINNTSSGAVTSSYSTTGHIYFSYATASNTSLSYRFMNSSFSTISGGSITLSATNGLGTSKTVNITGGTSPSLGSSTYGCWIEWTLSFTDTKDNVAKKAYAYTYVYKPYIVPVGGFVRCENEDGSSHYCQSATWMTGMHSITVGTLHDNGGYYPKRKTTFGLGGFMTSGSYGYVGSTRYDAGYGSRQSDCWADCPNWTSGADMRRFAFINTGTSADSYIKTNPNNDSANNYGKTSSDSETYSVRSMDYWYKNASGEYNRLAALYSGASGNIHIDTSRYSDLKQIPNLAIATMLTDNEGSHWGCWYISDASGVSSYRSTYSDYGAGDCRKVWDGKNYIIAGCGNSATDDSTTDSWDEEGIQYGGPWPRTMLGSTGTQNATYTYSFRSWHTQEEDSKGTNDWAYVTCLVDLKATYHNKANLRAAVQRAIRMMPALGINSISNGAPQSCYFNSDASYKLSAFQSAYKSAVIALGQLDNTSNMDTLASNLNSALNNLCTYVTVNGNGGSVSGTTGQYITIGTNQKTTYTPTATATRSGYTFLGWSTNASATTFANSVEVGYNNTVYAIWSKDVSATYVYLDQNGNKKTETYTSAGKNALNGYTLSITGNASTSTTIDGKTYQFIGWREDTTAGVQTFAATATTLTVPANGARTLYAVYSGDIKFTQDLNRGKDGANSTANKVETQTQYVNAYNTATQRTSHKFNIFAGDLYREAYDFLGWADSPEVEVAQYSKSQQLTISTDKTIYATWTGSKYDIVYVDYDGTVLGKEYDIRYNKSGATNATPVNTPEYYATAPAISATVAHHSDVNYHYQFLEWETTDSKNFIRYSTDGDNFYAFIEYLTDDITAYARYKAIAHSWRTIEGSEVESTCAAPGKYDRICTVCGYIERDVVIPELGHTMTVNEGYVAATCEKAGYSGDTYCTVCGYVEKAGEVVPALGHDYDNDLAEVVEATCTSRGYTVYKCANNEAHTYVDDYTDLKPHEYIVAEGETPADCTHNGYAEWAKCKNCGAVEIGMGIIPAYGHDIVRHARVEATCIDDGNIEYYECKRCGDLFEDATATVVIADVSDTVITANGSHTMDEAPYLAPTCTEDGHEAYAYCTVCGEGVHPEIIPATGHDRENSDIEPITPSTCIANGTAKLTCCVCGDEEIIELPLADHVTVVVPQLDPTCTTYGETAYTKCEVCGERFSESEQIAKIDHDYYVVENASIPATCEHAGFTVYACSMCGLIKDAVYQAPLGHKYSDMNTQVIPTCEELGLRVRYCTNPGCTNSIDEHVIDCVGHHFVDVAGIPATCFEAGISDSRACVNCGLFEEGHEPKVVSALGHDYTAKVVPPTCVLDGYTVVTCANGCDYYKTEDVVPAKGHVGGTATCTQLAVCTVCGRAYGEYERHNYQITVVEEGNCTTPQVVEHVCLDCGDSYTYTGEISGHKFDEDHPMIVPPTCTQSGSFTVECMFCDAVDTQVLDATGHNIEWTANVDGSASGVCSNCGETFETTAEEAGVETPECDKCGYHHVRNNFFFKYDGVYCKLVGFFRSIINFFKGK